MWDDLVESLKQLSSAGRFRELHAFRKDGVYLIDSDGNRLINFGSNDYLGLASVVASKVAKAPQVGATASGLVCGWTQSHQSLAVQLARFEDAESAVLFPSGFAACSGTIATLGRSGDLILSDQLNHVKRSTSWKHSLNKSSTRGSQR